jgi:SAM-dependent methyltransferase
MNPAIQAVPVNSPKASVAGHEICVNIGCGTDVAEGWWNIDNSPSVTLSRVPGVRRVLNLPEWPKDVHRHDVLAGMPFADGTVSRIYSSHTFEHFTYEQSVTVARECFRVLKVGGILRIVVPDLEKIVREYLNDPEPMASHRFIDRLLLSHTWRDALHPGAHHSQMFDGKSLAAMLREAGFSDPQVTTYGESKISDILKVELESRRRESLYVEAEKSQEAWNKGR